MHGRISSYTHFGHSNKYFAPVFSHKTWDLTFEVTIMIHLKSEELSVDAVDE